MKFSILLPAKQMLRIVIEGERGKKVGANGIFFHFSIFHKF